MIKHSYGYTLSSSEDNYKSIILISYVYLIIQNFLDIIVFKTVNDMIAQHVNY